MKSNPSYDLGKIIELVEKREALNTSLKLVSPPVIVIKDEEGSPIYKVTMSPFGDFLIYTNRSSNSILRMLTNISRMEDFFDIYETERESFISYIQAAELKRRGTSDIKKYMSSRGDRISGGTEIPQAVYNKKESHENWKIVFALPVNKSLEIVEFLYKIFKDDICNTEQVPDLSREPEDEIGRITARIPTSARWDDSEIPEDEGDLEEEMDVDFEEGGDGDPNL